MARSRHLDDRAAAAVRHERLRTAGGGTVYGMAAMDDRSRITDRAVLLHGGR